MSRSPSAGALVFRACVLPGTDEGHAVGAEVRLEVELTVKAPAAHFAGELAIGRVLSASFQGAPGPRLLHLARSLLLLVGDEAVAVEGDLGGEAEPTFPALVGALVSPVLGDVFLEVG